MSNPPQFKFKLVQISTDIQDYNDQERRFGEFYDHWKDADAFTSREIAFDMNSAESKIEAILKTSDDIPCVIVVNTHGDLDGIFEDTTYKFSVTPEIFWNGTGKPKISVNLNQMNEEGELTGNNPSPQKPLWKGMKKIIDEFKVKKPIFIIIAQCFGSQFGDKLRKIVGDAYNNLHIVGLSYACTVSCYEKGVYYHKDLREVMNLFQNKFIFIFF